MDGTLPERIWNRLSRRYRAFVAHRFPETLRRMPIGGDRVIYAPYDHPLDLYMEAHPYYDHWLPEAAALVCGHRPDGVVIDVGANVGDTIARIRRRGVTNRIVAVEASDHYFSILRRNAEAFAAQFGSVELLCAFVGNPNHSLTLQPGTGTAGTRIADEPAGSVREIPVRRLSELTADVPCFVKIDTDGYDASILGTDLEWLGRHKPVIWAETWIDTGEALAQWERVISALQSVYTRYILFDNVGVPVLWGPFAGGTDRMLQQLLGYAWMQREVAGRFGGSSSIPYFDIALFADHSEAAYDALLDAMEREFSRKGAPGPRKLNASWQ